jgi:hypothetical protein
MKIKILNMKKSLFLILFLILTTTSINAQQNNREKINLLKTSYLTDALNLTPQEAQKFWPVYNMYNDKIKASKKALESIMRKNMESSEGNDIITEEQALTSINEILALEETIYNNQTEMTKALLKVLPAKKVIKLQKAERDFNKRILQEYGRRKNQGN